MDSSFNSNKENISKFEEKIIDLEKQVQLYANI